MPHSFEGVTSSPSSFSVISPLIASSFSVIQSMDRWSGVLRVSLNPNTNNTIHFRVAASVCLSHFSKTPTVPSVNVVFFTGDRVEGTGNPVIERLSDLQHIAKIVVGKFGIGSNAWVIEASKFNGPFAVYKELIPSVNLWGEPKSYKPDGFPASTSTVQILLKSFEEVRKFINGGLKEPLDAATSDNEGFQEPQKISASSPNHPKTIVLGFSKGGVVLNQLVTELVHMKPDSSSSQNFTRKEPLKGNYSENFEAYQILPITKETFLNSISEIHYVDVGLNSSGAYITESYVFEKIVEHVMHGAGRLRFALHGTPRQWCDNRRPWIRSEKDTMLQLLENAAQRSAGKLQVSDRLYFADDPPNLQMHFEIIERLDMSC